MLPAIALLLLIGFAAGTLAGLLGIGGGLVIVPALTALLVFRDYGHDIAVPVAVATSLATMLMTSASSVWFHFRRGAVHWPTIARLGGAVAAGAAAGAWLATLISGDNLGRIFALVAGLIGLRMTIVRRAQVSTRSPFPRLWWIVGPLIGAASALIGIGGGTFNVPYLARNGYRMVEAVANAAACGWPIALAASITFVALEPALPGPAYALGHVWLPGMLTIGLGGMLAAPFGVALAHRLPAQGLRRIFGVALILVAARMAW